MVLSVGKEKWPFLLPSGGEGDGDNNNNNVGIVQEVVTILSNLLVVVVKPYVFQFSSLSLSFKKLSLLLSPNNKNPLLLLMQQQQHYLHGLLSLFLYIFTRLPFLVPAKSMGYTFSLSVRYFSSSDCVCVLFQNAMEWVNG